MNKNKTKLKVIRKLFLQSFVFGIFFMPIFSAAVVKAAHQNVRLK